MSARSLVQDSGAQSWSLRIALGIRLLRRRSQTKSVSARLSSARRRAIRGSMARSVLDCSLRSLRIAPGSRCLPRSLADEERVCSLARPGQRRAILVAADRARNPPHFVRCRRPKACPLASPQHGGARSGFNSSSSSRSLPAAAGCGAPMTVHPISRRSAARLVADSAVAWSLSWNGRGSKRRLQIRPPRAESQDATSPPPPGWCRARQATDDLENGCG